jgi:hypothetical protein
MSSFKQLNKADVTTVPYVANKQWNFSFDPNNSSDLLSFTSNDNFKIFKGKLTTGSFSPSEFSLNGQYERQIYSFINHTFYQEYNGDLLNTGSLMFNLLTYESASQQRPTASYFNYNINPNLIKNFPTGTGAEIKVFSFNQKTYGSKILPNSFRIKSGSVTILDDGYGNLFDIGQTEDDYIIPTWPTVDYFFDPTPGGGIYHVGNIFYAHGLAVITNPNYQSTFPIIEDQITFFVQICNFPGLGFNVKRVNVFSSEPIPTNVTITGVAFVGGSPTGFSVTINSGQSFGSSTFFSSGNITSVGTPIISPGAFAPYEFKSVGTSINSVC